MSTTVKKTRKASFFGIFAAVLALLAIGFGVYTVFFQTRGFVKTEAVIVSRNTALDEDGNEEFIPVVEYTVDGKTYTAVLDTRGSSSRFAVGKAMKILYNPQDPSEAHVTNVFAYVIMGVGVAVLAVVIGTAVRSRRALKELEKAAPAAGYAPSVKREPRHLYFLTDRGTAKYGHRIEDGNRTVLYEAKMTRFTLTTPYGFDFIDHEHGRTVPHLVGHEEASENNFLLIDNRYTFTFDGEDVWKHLKRNGVTVDSSFLEDKPFFVRYRIFRDGEEIAVAETASMNPHEEDEAAAGRLAAAIPARGYYRIDTAEENLDLLFTVLLAFARTAANDDRGGNYGLLFRRKRKETDQ